MRAIAPRFRLLRFHCGHTAKAAKGFACVPQQSGHGYEKLLRLTEVTRLAEGYACVLHGASLVLQICQSNGTQYHPMLRTILKSQTIAFNGS